MSTAHLAKTAFLLALGFQLAACSSSDERSLVLLDLQLSTSAAAPEAVRLSATSNGTEVKTAEVPWAIPGKTTLQVGLFIPAGVTGSVTVSAKGITSGTVVLEGARAVDLKAGGSVGPYPLVLAPTQVIPTSYDGGADSLAADAGPPEVGPLDGTPVDTGMADKAMLETGGIGGDSPVAPPDTPLPDAPALADTTDANVGQPDAPPADADGPAPGIDGAPDSVDAAHVPAWEPARNVENDVLYFSYAPAVTVDPISENVYVTWTESAAVKVRRWSRASGTWDKIVVVENRGSPQEAAIGADAKGNILLVWCQNLDDPADPMAGTWGSRTADGVAWSPPVRIGSLPTLGVQLTVARNGTARAVYQKEVSGETYPVFSAYFDGTAWTEDPTMIDPISTYTTREPLLVGSATGDGILILDRPAGMHYAITATTFAGKKPGTPLVLNANAETTVYGDRAIAMNQKGEAVFLWSEGNNSQMALYARTYGPTLGWSSPSPAIVSAGDIYSLAAGLDEQGQVTIVWQQPTTSGYKNLMGIHGSVAGSWSEITPLETDNLTGYRGEEYARPSMAIDGSGNVLVAWRKKLGGEAPDATYGAYASRFANGAWLPQVQLGVKTGLDVPYVRLAVSDKGLGAGVFSYISWSSTTDSDAYSAMLAFFR